MLVPDNGPSKKENFFWQFGGGTLPSFFFFSQWFLSACYNEVRNSKYCTLKIPSKMRIMRIKGKKKRRRAMDVLNRYCTSRYYILPIKILFHRGHRRGAGKRGGNFSSFSSPFLSSFTCLKCRSSLLVPIACQIGTQRSNSKRHPKM